MGKDRKISRITRKPAGKYQADNGEQYMDKRTIVRLARSAGKAAASAAMQTMGFVVVAKNGWVIRKYRDGHEEKIAPVDQL